MKNQIRLLALIVLTFFSLGAFAQTFGIKGGLNMSNLKWEDESGATSFKNRIGFHVGITAEFGQKFAFAPEILLSTKGAKVETDDGSGQVGLLYVDIPLNLKYTHDLGSAKIFGQAGPYVGIAVKGTDEWEGDEVDYSFGNDEEEDDFKRTDIGINFGGGLQFNQITIGVSYSLSMTTILPYDETLKNNVLYISIGYKF
jgi:opacity protein-like surface antigen